MELVALIVIVIVLAAFFLVRHIKSPSYKGAAGERAIALHLGQLNPQEYVVLNDIMLPTKTGTTQIDHIIVSIYGIFVLETKTFKGWIMGTEHGEFWTQNIYGKKYQFYNPILQNAGHVHALRQLLNQYEPLEIHPIVAFSGEADIKVHIEEACVVYWGDIIDVIHRHDRQLISFDNVGAICNTIRSSNIAGKERKSIQGASIYQARSQKNDAFESGKCPRCGGSLVIREGRYGRFYGCSNYPNCRFTHPC